MSNKEQVALDLQRFSIVNSSKGNIEDVHAFSPQLCHEVIFPEYQECPSSSAEKDPSAWQEWYEHLNGINVKLTWLLKLPHHKFWCQVINDTTLQCCLESYIRYAPRYHKNFPDDIAKLHSSVHHLVFLSYIRMASHKESSKCFITPSVFGEVIYEYFLFDIPKLMDICAVYCNEVNTPLLTKAVANIFKHQPKYQDDLTKSFSTVLQIILNLEQKCGQTAPHEDTRPGRLSESENTNMLLDMPLLEFKDNILWISDIFHTLYNFLTVYSDACKELMEKNFIKTLSRFYSQTLQMVATTLNDRNIEDLSLKSHLWDHVGVAKYNILRTINLMLKHCLLEPAIKACDENKMDEMNELAEQYLEILSELVEDAKLFMDLSKVCGLLEDVKAIIETCPSIDEARASFLFGAMGVTAKTLENLTMSSVGSSNISQVSYEPPETSTPLLNQPSDFDTSSQAPSQTELDSLVSSLQDMLPDLSSDFVKICLSQYEYNAESTLNAILEDSLPEDVSILDRTKDLPDDVMSSFLSYKTQPSVLEHSIQSEENIMNDSVNNENMLQSRQNIFDNDEFDVFNRTDVDTSRIHQGKMDKNEDLEKFDASDMKKKYEQYAVITDQVKVLNEDVYDDEYDDTYDGVGIDANDADDADDLMTRRPFVTPRVFMQGRKEKIEVEESNDSEDEEEGERKNKDHFISNPADIRARNEARRQQQRELRDAQKPSHRRGYKKPIPGARTQTFTNSAVKEKNEENSDAKYKGARTKHQINVNEGKPSNKPAQATSKDEKDRKHKDVNKAKVANHNRKSLSTHKFSKGMTGHR